MAQTKQCSRCSSKALTENDFGIDKNGNFFKTCNACRDSSNIRKTNNEETIQQYSREYYLTNRDRKLEQTNEWRKQNSDKLITIVRCECGGKFQ